MIEGIGIVLVTHEGLGGALVDTCVAITGTLENLTHVAVMASDGVEEVRKNIDHAINSVKGDRGAILLVDMFGGTPSNISLSFLAEGKVEVVTGVNLPMLLKVAAFDSTTSLDEAARMLRDYGRQHIKVAAEYLSGK